MAPERSRGDVDSLILGAPRAAPAAGLTLFARARGLLFHPDPKGLGYRNGLSTLVFYVLAAAGGSGA